MFLQVFLRCFLLLRCVHQLLFIAYDATAELHTVACGQVALLLEPEEGGDSFGGFEPALRVSLPMGASEPRAEGGAGEVGNEAPPEHLRSNKRWYHNKVNPGSRELSTWPGNLDSASVAREGTGRLKEAVGKKRWPEKSPDEL